jgi:uncharacterized protein (TIRG00374 family)
MKALRLVIVLLVTLIFVGIALWGIDLGETIEIILDTQWAWFLAVFVCYLLTHSIRTFRLWLLVEKKGSFLSMFSINTIGFLAINIIPLRLGEMLRPYLLLEKEGIPFPQGMAAIILERWLDMCMLLLMLLGLGWFVDLPEQGLEISGIDIITVGQNSVSLVVILGSIFGMGLVLISEDRLSILKKLPLGSKLYSFVFSFRIGMKTLFSNPLLAIQLFILSSFVWGFTIASVYFALRAFPSIPNDLSVAWSTWTITLVGMIVAPTPGFVGVYELFCSSALLLWEVPKTVGTSFALALHGSQLSFTIITGISFLLWEGFSLKKIITKSREFQAATGSHSSID